MEPHCPCAAGPDPTTETGTRALNLNNASVTQTFTIMSGIVSSFRQHTTSASKKLSDDGSVTVTDHSFTVSLDPQSITTFVAE